MAGQTDGVAMRAFLQCIWRWGSLSLNNGSQVQWQPKKSVRQVIVQGKRDDEIEQQRSLCDGACLCRKRQIDHRAAHDPRFFTTVIGLPLLSGGATKAIVGRKKGMCMGIPSSNVHKPAWEKRLSLHFGSFDALISFLLRHKVEEVCVKSLVSPTASWQGESLRHLGVCVSACIDTQLGTPLVYATFLAGSGAWGGKHSRLLYPKLDASDPLRLLPAQEALERLQRALFFSLERALQGISAFTVVPDAQWDVADAWLGIAKGFVWRNGEWQNQPSSPASLFSPS